MNFNPFRTDLLVAYRLPQCLEKTCGKVKILRIFFNLFIKFLVAYRLPQYLGKQFGSPEKHL